MKDFLNDFKAFAFKGNMMDLAIGMIIGAAFTALVNSVVNNLFMPVLSVFTGGIDFSNLYLPLSTGSKDAFMAGADVYKRQVIYMVKIRCGLILFFSNK